MPSDIDPTDLSLLAELQNDGRMSHAELARRVGLSGPSVADRLRRLEQSGVITGYAVRLDPAKLGLGVVAFIRLAPTGHRDDMQNLLHIPEIMETHHVVGDDCWVFKVAVPDVVRLEEILAEMTEVGSTTTSIVLSSPITANTLSLPTE